MIISHKHKFILLHAGKCAGISIRHCLDDIIKEDKIEIPKNHPTLTDCQEIIKMSNHDPKEYMIVAMVRNPFDRMVSWYYYRLHNDKRCALTFEDFCKKPLMEPNENLIPPYSRCDHVIRYEHLQEDFDTFLNLIGLPPHKLPHFNKNPDRPKQDYRLLYTEKTKQMVANYFDEVIKMFDYQF